MPDHLRQPKNAIGLARSPAGSDSPLSLVIDNGRRDHHYHHQDQYGHQNKSPPHLPTYHESESRVGREGSFGFSESPTYSPVRIEVDHDQPLSLVVPKKKSSASGVPVYDDSGHDTESSRSSLAKSPETKDTENGLKIKDFAKFSLGEDARDKIPQHREDTLLAALTAPPKARTLALPPGPVPPHRSAGNPMAGPPPGVIATPQGAAVVEGPPTHHDIDAMSEVSSMSSMSDLIHAQRIGEHTVYPCDFCDKVFGNRYHLASHLVTHTGERSFECKFCQKSFGRRSTLRAHVTTHTKTSNFMCPLCEKACNDNNSLEEHIRMHTGEKPFVCTICAKAYARKSHLNVHYRVHTGERPFVCMSCGKDFTEKRFLNDHMQTAHSGNDGPLKCPNCFREFAYKTSLKQHLKKQMCAKNLNRGQPGGGAGCGAGAGSAGSQVGGSSSSQSGGVHAKQFACPFCEKSYSWKQTLKQHVSMYHRNKVHTDEFWKYELAKHRRTVLDSKTNEDMWKKQLGKHVNGEQEAEQAAKAMAALAGGGSGSASAGCSRSHSLERKSSTSPPAGTSPQLPAVHPNAPGRSPAAPQPGTPVDDHWLEQIKRSTTNDPNQNSQVSNEMKLLALHSLQSSLQMMSMKLPMKPPMTTPTTMASSPASGGVVPTVVEQEQPQVERPKSPIISRNPTPPGATPQAQPQGYLSLLAHLSAQRKAEQNSDLSEQLRSAESDQQIRDQQQRSQSESSIAPYLSDMKEEPAAKRTQMWLAQLGQYKHKPASVGGVAGGSPASTIGFQDEIDRNHDELWEEQIAKAKSHPVKSPLEPIEITIVDQENDNDLNSGCKALLPPPMVARPPTPLSPIRQRSPSCNNVISIKTSAIQRMVNHPRTFSLSLEVNNNNTDPNSNGCDPIGVPTIAVGIDLKPRNRHIPVPLLPTSRPSLMNPPPVKRGRFLEIPEETEETSNVNPVSDHDVPVGTADQAASIATEAPVVVVPASEDSSVLKSLLMDRMMSGPRKRTLSEALKPAEPAKRLSVNGDSDILRRRLLGIKSEEQQPQEQPPKQLLLLAQQPQQLQPTQQQRSLPPKPKFQPPTATVTSQQQLQKQQFHPVAHLEEPNNLANSINIQDVPSSNLMFAPASHPVNASHGPIDLRKEQQHPASAAASQQQKNYTQTSVLKHLLYRYTNSSEGLDPRSNKQQTNSSGNTSPESSDESVLNSS